MKYQLAALVLILPLIITASSTKRSLSIRHSPNLGTSNIIKRKAGKSKKTKRATGAKQAPVNDRADATFQSSSKNNSTFKSPSKDNSTVGSLQEELSPSPLVSFQENPSDVSGYIPLFKLSYCAIMILCELF